MSETGVLATVVIVNWNGEHLLPATLDALRAQDFPRDRWQAWVVDNGSADGSVALVRERYPEVNVLETGANLGFAGGNNAVLRSLETPYAVLLNSDARPEPNWLSALIGEMESRRSERIAALTAKMLFQPRFFAVELDAPAYRPPADSRELGVAVSGVEVRDERGAWVDVTRDVLWERLTYARERGPDGDFRWTRPRGVLHVPVPGSERGPREPRECAVAVRLWLRGPRDTEATLVVGEAKQAFAVPADRRTACEVATPAVALVDVVNNAGSVLVGEGYGADRGFQEVDTGQYDEPAEVFAFCGGAVCLRADALAEAGLMDDRFFLYYEDTDLSWRLRAAGWSIRYEPAAVVRHVHSASAGEWSPVFTFHVDRNRLLMLARNATPRLAVQAAVHYVLFAGKDVLRAVRRTLATRSRPDLAPHVLRLRVVASYLRLLPAMLADRRANRALRRVPPAQIQARWLEPPRG